MRVLADGAAAAALEEVEIGAGVGALHMVVVAAGHSRWPAARSRPSRRRAGPPVRSSGMSRCRRRFGTSSSIMSPSRTTASGPPARGLGRGVQHHGAIGRAGHARVGDAHHVGDALAQHLRRQAHVADLGHAGIAARAAVLQHHHAGLVDVERLVVDLAPCSRRYPRTRPPGPGAVIRCGDGGRGLQHRAVRARGCRAAPRCRPARSAPSRPGGSRPRSSCATSFTSSQIVSPETVSASRVQQAAPRPAP